MKVLIVIDMQNDFIDGALGTKQAQQIVPAVIDKVNEYQQQNECVIFTRDTHHHDYLHTQEGTKLPIEHCIRDTKGWQITDALTSATSEIIDKPSFGTLVLPKVIEKATNGVVDSILLVGLCTDICVISNAMILKAAYPEVPIQVDASCCAGVTQESHNNALQAMKMCQITILNEDKV